MRRGQPTCGARGQSEVIGIILLVAVVITLVVGVGALVIADWQSDAERETQVNVASDLTATELTLEHLGGDTIAPEDVLVVLQGTDEEFTLADGNFDSNADQFEAGSRWRYSSFSPTLGGKITLRVFDTSTNTLLHEKTYDVE